MAKTRETVVLTIPLTELEYRELRAVATDAQHAALVDAVRLLIEASRKRRAKK